MNEQTPAAVAATYFDSLGRGDVPGAMSLLSPDVVWHQPGANQFSGDHAGIERVAAEVDLRSREKPVVLRLREAEIGAGHVAHRREASPEHLSHDLRGLRIDIRGRGVVERSEVGASGDDVDVSVDELGEHAKPRRVDDPIRRGVELIVDRDDASALTQDVDSPVNALVDVEDVGVPDEERRGISVRHVILWWFSRCKEVFLHHVVHGDLKVLCR